MFENRYRRINCSRVPHERAVWTDFGRSLVAPVSTDRLPSCGTGVHRQIAILWHSCPRTDCHLVAPVSTDRLPSCGTGVHRQISILWHRCPPTDFHLVAPVSTDRLPSCGIGVHGSLLDCQHVAVHTHVEVLIRVFSLFTGKCVSRCLPLTSQCANVSLTSGQVSPCLSSLHSLKHERVPADWAVPLLTLTAV
jgi:hypothetical protein